MRNVECTTRHLIGLEKGKREKVMTIVVVVMDREAAYSLEWLFGEISI